MMARCPRAIMHTQCPYSPAMHAKIALVPVTLLCSGCSLAPSVAIFGAFFPAWMVCALLGLVLAVVARAVASATGLSARQPAPPLLYPMLALLFGAVAWLILFRG